MRLFPILTAILVMAVLYMFVLQRDTMMALAGIETAQAEATTEQTSVAPGAPNEAELAPVKVVVQRSTARQIASGVVLRGQTEAARKLQVRAETSGLVISDPTPKGTRVSKGQVLCRLDPGTREANLQEARARLAEAEVNARAAEGLAARGFASEAQLAARKAALEAAQAAVKRAEKEIERLTIEAPFDGILETDTAELGLLLQPGAPCATIIKLDPIRLVGYAPENEIDRIRLGARARARLASGMQVEGMVTFLASSADPRTRTFRVEVEVPNPDAAIRDGATVEMFIAYAGETAHLLPSSALTLDDEGRLGIRAVVDGRAAFMPVSILRDTADGVWLAGLPDQVDVIVVGQEYAGDGHPVIPTFREP